VLNPKSVADSVCKIETELCYLHGLLAAEELGTIVKQSGEAPNQQLKPKMPSYEEASNGIVDISDKSYHKLEFVFGAKAMYEYIARHFGR